MNALLVQTTDNSKPSAAGSDMPTLVLSDVRGFSTTPTAHVRDLVAAGIKPAGCMVYFAIADRQVKKDGYYCRSNEKLAEECGVSVSHLGKCLSDLRKNGFIVSWYVNGNRRMRALTKVSQVSTQSITGDRGGTHIRVPYKENTTKKTLQQCDEILFILGRRDGVLWGGSLERLVATHGLDAVRRGLAVYDSYDPKTIDNPIGFLTDAIKQKWLPPKKKPKKFTECPLEHEKIIQAYIAGNEEHATFVKHLRHKGQADSLIACKIFRGKI